MIRRAALSIIISTTVTSPLAAQGLPVETASHFPVALWFVGAVILGLAMAYGVMRTRGRTRAEKEVTETATRKNYAEEDRRPGSDNLGS
jgi:hypothetical protein